MGAQVTRWVVAVGLLAMACGPRRGTPSPAEPPTSARERAVTRSPASAPPGRSTPAKASKTPSCDDEAVDEEEMRRYLAEHERLRDQYVDVLLPLFRAKPLMQPARSQKVEQALQAFSLLDRALEHLGTHGPARSRVTAWARKALINQRMQLFLLWNHGAARRDVRLETLEAAFHEAQRNAQRQASTLCKASAASAYVNALVTFARHPKKLPDDGRCTFWSVYDEGLDARPQDAEEAHRHAQEAFLNYRITDTPWDVAEATSVMYRVRVRTDGVVEALEAIAQQGIGPRVARAHAGMAEVYEHSATLIEEMPMPTALYEAKRKLILEDPFAAYVALVQGEAKELRDRAKAHRRIARRTRAMMCGAGELD